MSSDLRSEIERLGPWFHNLHLPDGTETCPGHALGDFPTVKWRAFEHLLPKSLDGWTALDVGCNAGFYSFELARRGAQVTAIDVDERYLDQARWAAARFGLERRVEFRRAQVYELARTYGTWDLVLFLGVFYHLRYPMLGLDIVTRKVGRMLVFQSLSTPGADVRPAPENMTLDERQGFMAPGWPKLAFIENRLENDPTNWWAPNHACSEAMLRSMGMRLKSHPAHEIYVCEPDPDAAQRGYRKHNEEFESIFGSSLLEGAAS